MGFFVLVLGLAVSLKADGHKLFIAHCPQRGLRGVHTVCPNPTCKFETQPTEIDEDLFKTMAKSCVRYI